MDEEVDCDELELELKLDLKLELADELLCVVVPVAVGVGAVVGGVHSPLLPVLLTEPSWSVCCDAVELVLVSSSPREVLGTFIVARTTKRSKAATTTGIGEREELALRWKGRESGDRTK